MTTLIIDLDEYPNFDGQEAGRELELELTGVVMLVVEGGPPSVEGGSPSRYVELTIVRADITQTT